MQSCMSENLISLVQGATTQREVAARSGLTIELDDYVDTSEQYVLSILRLTKSIWILIAYPWIFYCYTCFDNRYCANGCSGHGRCNNQTVSSKFANKKQSFHFLQLVQGNMCMFWWMGICRRCSRIQIRWLFREWVQTLSVLMMDHKKNCLCRGVSSWSSMGQSGSGKQSPSWVF